MRNQTVCDDIVSAFNEMGVTTLHLSQIYEKVKERRERRGEDVGEYYLLKSYIRWELQNNSRCKGKNIFIMVKKGSGLWSLRSTAN
jgi:hypothetical protein